MLKNSKIKHIVLACLISFAIFILLFLFVMQILFLNNYYEYYKTKQLNYVADTIKNSSNINIEDLENLAYNNGLCISVYTNNEERNISSSFNAGCMINDKMNNTAYVSNFISSGKNEDTYYLRNKRFDNRNIIRAIKYNNNIIFINTSIEPLDSSIKLLKSQYLYIVIVIFAASLAIGYFISKLISDPIEELSSSAEALSKGNFKTKFTTKSSIVEIKKLATTLEGAKIELSKTDELRKDLMANVGHDLRTPLTMIKAYAEMTRDLDQQTKEKRTENLNIIIEETDRLNVLVSDILDLSKLQSNTYELKMEKFDINELIKNIIKRYDILVEKENYNIIYDNTSKIIVNADKVRIEQVIYNLLNNAINYTGEDKKVFINVIDTKKDVTIEIKDTGKGIAKEEINSVWNKYYHNEKKHKRNAYGTGLGLSIVKTILESHKYKYGIKSEKNKGTTMYFVISKTK